MSIQSEILRRSVVRKVRCRFPGAGLPVVMAAASAVLRLLTLWRQGGLSNDIEYDDGVHLGSSLLLAHGQVLYRNQVFLHPPGISLLLLPFSWASAWWGQPAMFALTRLVTVGVAAAGAGLVTYVVGRSTSRIRAVVAGAFAVVFAPSIVAGSTLMLEPWLGLFGLLAVERLTRSSPRRVDVILAGCFLGYATVIKAWGVIPLAGVAIWLLCERRRRALLRLLTAAAATITAVIGPFLVLGGGRLVADVVWTQLRRPPDGIQGLLARTADALGLTSHLLVAIVLVGLAVLIWRAVHVPGVGRLSAIVLTIAIPVFANAPSFFFHYGDFFTPWVALLIATQPALRWSPRVIPALVMIALLHQSAGLLRRQRPADMNTARLQRLVGRHACVVSHQASLLLLAGAFDRPGCPSWLDPRGAALTELRGREIADFYPSGFQRLPRWQDEYVGVMAHADLLLLTGEPCRHPEWTAATCHWVQAHFARVAEVGHAGPGRVTVAVWQRR